MENKYVIITPIGPRVVPMEVIKLFETVPTEQALENRPSKYEQNGYIYEWLEVNGKLVTKAYPARA
jgi:hypothetical protein